MSEAALKLDRVSRVYEQASGALTVFRNVSLEVRPGEIVALVGPSGAGKSSLLHIAGLLEEPSEGEVFIAGRSAASLSERERTQLRRDTLGFVYQFHHLLPEFSARENVALPMRMQGKGRQDAETAADAILAQVGLAQRVTHRPSQLSGGEQQRVAIARALANAPRVLLADEPTGNLDPHTADAVFAMLIERVRASGLSALIATHNYDLTKKMDRTLKLSDGTLA